MWLRARMRAGRDILSARLRVDESVLRARQMDELPGLLEAIRAAKKADPELDL